MQRPYISAFQILELCDIGEFYTDRNVGVLGQRRFRTSTI
jgi:hypothetical protein